MMPLDSSALLLVISAPSGGGKTTLCEGLLRARPGLVRAVTCTTRPAREGEREGVDYHFLTAETFLKRVQAGHFVEHATVYGHSYGVLRSELMEQLGQGRDVLLAVDVQGVATIRAKARQDAGLGRALVTIFLAPPNLKELERRLRRRNQDPAASIEKRLSMARQEIVQWPNFDYVIVSQTPEDDLRRMLAILEAEKLRQPRVRLPDYE